MALVLPTGDMLKKVQVELNIEEGREKDDVAQLKTWLEKQPHLPQDQGMQTNKLTPSPLFIILFLFVIENTNIRHDNPTYFSKFCLYFFYFFSPQHSNGPCNFEKYE